MSARAGAASDTELAAQRAREAYRYVARTYPTGAPLEALGRPSGATGLPMKRPCGSYAASPAARRSGGRRRLWGRCEAYKAAHAACRGAEGAVSSPEKRRLSRQDLEALRGRRRGAHGSPRRTGQPRLPQAAVSGRQGGGGRR
jgi:hypothetical protein